jgi:hypothetical protein
MFYEVAASLVRTFSPSHTNLRIATRFTCRRRALRCFSSKAREPDSLQRRSRQGRLHPARAAGRGYFMALPGSDPASVGLLESSRASISP